MKEIKYNAKVVVKTLTQDGGYCLEEIPFVKEGDEIIGKLSESGSFTFKHKSGDAVLYVGENCELLEIERINLAVFKGKEIDDEFDIEEKKQAIEYAKEIHGELMYGVEYENIRSNGASVLPFYSKSLAEARKKAYKEFIG